MNKLKKIFLYMSVFIRLFTHFIFDRQQRIKLKGIVLSKAPKLFSRKHASVSLPHDYRLICVDGHGHSGGGAASDFLREFDNIAVNSDFDPDGTTTEGIKEIKKNTATSNTEIKIITDSNGLLDLELILTSCTSGSSKSEALNRFVALNETCYVLDGGIFNDEYMRLVWEFVDSLCYYKTFSSFPVGFRALDPGVRYSNIVGPTLSWPHKEGYYFFVKTMTPDEFRKQAAIFLNKVINKIESKEYLMLDALVSCSCGIDYAVQQEYVPGIKTVFVCRDPRDQYATACTFDLKWMPKDDINAFITWAENQRQRFRLEHKDILTVHFEDLVLDYGNTTRRIMDFFGLDKKNHLYPKKFFDPEISKKNVGLYKTLIGKEKEIKMIEEKLIAYCLGGGPPPEQYAINFTSIIFISFSFPISVL
jgi:hypothetical protein